MANIGLKSQSPIQHHHDHETLDSQLDEYVVKDHGWKVRKIVEDKNEIKQVAQIQAESFHVSTLFFDHLFFHFFQAEVLWGLLFRLRNYPPDRYACLVAEPGNEDDTSSKSQAQDCQKLVGVVDVTVLRDNNVTQHLDGAEKYLYVSGIAISKNYRRQKVGTVLLKACEVISVSWGCNYLVLTTHNGDKGALELYTKAGYRVVSQDPFWFSLIGRKRRDLMIKRL